MTIDPNELQAAIETIFGRTLDDIKTGLAAGDIAVKQATAATLLDYARGRAAAKSATFSDELARLETLHLRPVRDAKEQAESASRQQIATLEAALADLTAKRDASLPTQEQIDAAIVGFGE